MRTEILQTVCRKAFAAVFAVMAVCAYSQRHEVGLQLGMTNMVGDIGRTNYILQKPLGDVSYFGIPIYFGGMYRMNFNPYQTVRFNLGYSNIQFSDAHAKEDYRNKRGYKGTNSVYNLDAQFEYNFLPVNNEQKSMLSPYVFGGLGAISFTDHRALIDVQTKLQNDNYATTTERFNNFALSIPFGAGLKYKFNYNWALSGEFKFRYNFTDNIDYSKFDEQNVRLGYYDTRGKFRALSKNDAATFQNAKEAFVKANNFGNPNSNDWINSITLGLTYSFGRPPCYCE